LVSSKSGKRSFLRKIPDKKITLSLAHYSPIKEEEDILGAILPLLPEEKEKDTETVPLTPEEKDDDEDYGEYTEFFQNLKPDVQEKIRNYPKEKHMEILRQLQKPKKKVVTIDKTK
jgi:hypothetical protein